MNKLAPFAIAILLISGAALWLLAPGAFNNFIKEQIQVIGSETTAQTVTVNNVDFQLTQGKASINGFAISNPKQYQQKNAFTLGSMSLDIDISSLTKEPIVIESFTIKDAKAFIEITKSGQANFKEIIAAINEKMPLDKAAKSSEQTQTEPKVRIEQLILSGIALNLDLRQLGLAQYQETLPKINLGNVGGKKGLAASQLGMEIGRKILTSIWQQAKQVQGKKLTAQLKKKAQSRAKKIKKKAKTKAKELKEKAKKKLGSLFDKLAR
jgi:uncharacterized protein involved in outer membrane biogenesis